MKQTEKTGPEESSEPSKPETLALQVGLSLHEIGRLGDLELTVLNYVTADSLGELDGKE